MRKDVEVAMKEYFIKGKRPKPKKNVQKRRVREEKIKFYHSRKDSILQVEDNRITILIDEYREIGLDIFKDNHGKYYVYNLKTNELLLLENKQEVIDCIMDYLNSHIKIGDIFNYIPNGFFEKILRNF